jgi:hypothetical protein
MLKHFLLLFFFLLISGKIFSQGEILCTVTIDVSPNVQLQTADKGFLDLAKATMTNLMNNTKWTTDVFNSEERIRCNLYLTITNIPTQGVYEATAQIQSSRPVYGTGYETEVLNFFDKKFNFEYSQSQIVNFNENSFTSNLASMIGFYAYVIIGLDYDTFSKLGGSSYIEKTRSIANVAFGGAGQVSVPGQMDGWNQDNGNNNRYWLAENLNHQQLMPFREGLYNYHRLAMDKYQEKPDEARKEILAVLAKIKTVNSLKPYAVLIRSFFTAKSTELINIFMDGTPEQKQQAVTLLRELDPLNGEKYSGILN